MSKVIGIDLGTTNSCVAVYENGETKLSQIKREKYNSINCPFTDKKVKFLVGDPAKTSDYKPWKTIYSIKKLWVLMMNEPNAKAAQSKVGYKIVDRNGAAAVEIGGKVYTPQEISAKIFRKIKSWCRRVFRSKSYRCCYYSSCIFQWCTRKATQAGTIAGLNVLKIINEPTAASLAYGLDKKLKKSLVYDLGGGTFDVTVLGWWWNFWSTQTDGNAFLSGDDFDNRIIDSVEKQKFKDENGFDVKMTKWHYKKIKRCSWKC